MYIITACYLENNLQYKEWDDFLLSCKGSTVFNTHAFAKQYARTLGIEYKILAAFHKDKIIAGILFFTKKNRTVIITPPFYTYNGFVINTNGLMLNQERKIESIFRHLINKLLNDHHFVVFTNNTKNSNMLTFNDLGFSSLIKYTYVTNLDDLQHLYNNFNLKHKNQIRKAYKYSPELKIGTDLANIKCLFSLWTGSLKDTYGEVPFRIDEFIKLVYHLNKLGFLEVFSMSLSNNIIAAFALLKYKKKAFLWIGGYNKNYSYTGINCLIHWEIIKYLSFNKFHTLDLLGANLKEIAFFKSKFNFNLEPFYVLYRYKDRRYKCLFMLKKLLIPNYSLWKI